MLLRSGSFASPRSDLEKSVVENGGKCGSVGKDTILVWDGSITGGKYEKAKKNNSKIISEEEFQKMLL